MAKTLLIPMAGLALLAVSCNRPAGTEVESAAEPAKTTVKYGIRVQPGPMDSILLKDYAPASSLVVPETRVPKARFPVIDVHSHSSMSQIKTAEDVTDWVRTMDEVGLEKSIVFTGATGDDFDRQVELFKPYGDRFQLWCDLETRDIDAPDYPQRAAAELERCYRKGARGIGELSDKGSGLQNAKLPRDKRLHYDDHRLELVWKKAAELKIPVNFHVADHPSCWQPLGPNQERTPDFQHFNLADKDVPSYEELIAMSDRMLEKNRGTRFIACHLRNQGNDLGALSKALDRHPNLFLDISARDYEIGRQPRTAAKFLTRYQDRVMFGTDMGRAKDMYQTWWRLLETDDEYLPGRIWWRVYGLQLPPQVLESLYRKNALRLLSWEKT